MLAFRDRSADALGCPRYGEDVVAAYHRLCRALFDDAKQALWETGPAAVDVVVDAWKRMMRTTGRRGGRAVEKAALDILSYEAEASLRRCYSCAWHELIRQMGGSYGLSVESLRFLQLWHCERISASNTPGRDFHLFHGHVFALHPATGMLLCTPTGRRLVGEYVVAPTPETQLEPFQKLLAAINVGLFCYSGRRQETRRRKQPVLARDGDVESLAIHR
jgi:hypothetical protein